MKTKISVIISAANKSIKGERQGYFVLCLWVCVLFFLDTIFLKGDAIKHGNKGHSEQKNRIKTPI